MTNSQIRSAAFAWLDEQALIHRDFLPRNILVNNFYFHDQRVVLIGASGIWKPKQMSLPISITTSYGGPYHDGIGSDNDLMYRYRGTDPNHYQNVQLRECMRNQVPLIYFFGILPSKYMAAWPVFIIADDIKGLTFTAVVDDVQAVLPDTIKDHDPEMDFRRSYITTNTRMRLHQQSFRVRVLDAYRNRCTCCNLQHTELLDAAHIIPDKELRGEPVVQNGLSLCKIHHAAFDQNILGITPDYRIKIREDILEETDGPMLKHGIQSLENSKLILPRNREQWPDKERLEERYDRFRSAG